MSAIRISVSLLVMGLALLPNISAQTQYLPQLAVGGSSTGTNMQTLVFLFNSAAVSISGTGEIFNDQGGPFPVVINRQGSPVSNFSWTLAPGQTQRFLFTGLSPTIESAWLRITPQGSRFVGVTLIFQLYEGSELLSEAGVLPSGTQTNATLVYERLGATNTGVALANPSDQSITVMLHIYNGQGDFLRTESILLPGRGHRSLFIDQIFSLISFPPEGTIVMTSSRPFAAVAIRLNSGRLSTVPVLPNTRPQPQITNLSPDAGRQGETIENLVITGVNLTGAPAIVFDPSTAIGVTILSATDSELRARLVIDASAPIRSYNMMVTTRSLGIDLTSNPLVFRVVSATSPSLDSISPSSAEPGSNFTLTLTGTNLASATAVEFDPPAGIMAPITATTATEVRAQVSIAPTAAVGPRAVRVMTSTGVSNSRTFIITTDVAAPLITGILPPFPRVGDTINPFILQGINLGNVTSIEFSAGSGITGTVMIPTSPTEVRANVLFDRAAFGAYTVAVRTASGRLSNLFTFSLQQNPERPSIMSLSKITGTQGQTIDPFIITGANLVNIESINFTPPLLGTATILSQMPGEVMARLVIAGTATVGAYQVTVTRRVDETTTSTSLPATEMFTVTAAP